MATAPAPLRETDIWLSQTHIVAVGCSVLGRYRAVAFCSSAGDSVCRKVVANAFYDVLPKSMSVSKKIEKTSKEKIQSLFVIRRGKVR